MTPFLLGAQEYTPEIEEVKLAGTNVHFKLAKLAGGTFEFGGGDAPLLVELSPFWIGTHEVTHDAYRCFQNRENDSPATAPKAAEFSVDAVSRPSPPYLDFTYGMGTRGGYPQVNTTQQAALRYCAWLYQKTGDFYRLPTEAEWEYACLAGSGGNGPVGVANDEALLAQAWVLENSNEKFQLTGQKAKNPWGLYDMLGNVSEWTLDQYAKDYAEAVGTETQDPWLKPSRKHSRTVRGGSYDTYAEDCNCRVREKSSPRWQERDPQIPKSIWWNVDAPFVGFRLVRPVQQPTASEIAAFFAAAIID